MVLSHLNSLIMMQRSWQQNLEVEEIAQVAQFVAPRD